jgi:DNA-binding response OmpR family regulator
MKILLADDSRVTRNLLRSILEDLDYEVTTAENGLEAWRIYERERMPVLISDWEMPAMDGLELCKRVRSSTTDRTEQPYIMLVTGLGDMKHFIAGMAAGADDFIVKPFEPELLRCRLRVAERTLAMQHELRLLAAALPACGTCGTFQNDPASLQRLQDHLATHPELKPMLGNCPTCAAKA